MKIPVCLRQASVGMFLAVAPIWVVQAGDCWVPMAECRVTGFGDATTARRHAPFREALIKAAAVLKADGTLNAIPRVRYQAHLHLGPPVHPGAPKAGEVAVFLHKPDAWAGTCGLKPWSDNVHFVQLEVALNDLTALGAQAGQGEHSANSQDQALPEADFFSQPKKVGERGGHPVFENDAGNRVLLITPGGIKPFVPVTVGEYLDFWQRSLQAERQAGRGELQAMADNREMRAYIAQLRKTDAKTAAELQASLEEATRLAQEGDSVGNEEWQALQQQRAGLSPARRGQPVYLSSAAMEGRRFGYTTAPSGDATPLVRVNPALWAGRKNESEVRSVALQVRVQDGDSAAASGADRWLERVDPRPYRALLNGGGK